MSELLDIVDEDGEPTGETVDREIAHRDGIRHRTSHVWLVRKGPTNALEVLLQKRAANKDAFPGCWDISSAGHIPAGDDWVTSALRELKEELGVEAKPDDLHWLGKHKVESDGIFHGRPFHNRQISALFVLPLDKPESEFVLQASEIEAVHWMDINECRRAVENKTIPNCISLSELLWIKSNVLSGVCGEELKHVRDRKMKTLHSLSELKKLKIAPAPGGASAPAKQSVPTEEPPATPKRTPREEFAALLGDAAPPPAKRGIGQKASLAQPAQKAPERPREAPAPRRPPTVRIDGPAGGRALSAGSVAVLSPGETNLVVEADGAPSVEVRLVVEQPKPEVIVRHDTAQAAALARAEKEVARLAEERDRLAAENAALHAKLKAVVRIDADELFPGEAYEHVIEALAREAGAAKAVDGRRAEILEAVVGANPPATELPRRRRIVDEVLVSARRPGPRELARLAEIGIREVSKNKHYKLGYGKHTQTLALTPSDHRGGQNAAADMKAKFF